MRRAAGRGKPQYVYQCETKVEKNIYLTQNDRTLYHRTATVEHLRRDTFINEIGQLDEFFVGVDKPLLHVLPPARYPPSTQLIVDRRVYMLRMQLPFVLGSEHVVATLDLVHGSAAAAWAPVSLPSARSEFSFRLNGLHGNSGLATTSAAYDLVRVLKAAPWLAVPTG